jgi:hypothetical protein
MSYAAASTDGLHVAIARDHELSLYTVEPFLEIARTQLAPSTDRVVAFVGRQVLVHETTRLAVYSMQQRLARTANLELDRPYRLVATSAQYALLATPDATMIATCTSDGTALAPTRTPVITERAVGLDGGRFLIWGKQGTAEIWAANTKLPTARIALDLPPSTIDAGATAKHRSVWLALANGDLIVSRLSDGKATLATLPKGPQHITWHPASAWLVAEVEGVPYAINSVLRSMQQLAIPAGRPRTVAPSVGSHAYVIVDEGSEIGRYEVGVESEPKIVRITVGAPLPEGEELVPQAQPTPVQRVKERVIETEVKVEVKPAEPVAPTLASRFANRGGTPAAKPPRGAADWHEPLLAWSKRIAEAPATELPAIPSPIATLCDRAQLDLAARRIVHALAADWLAGHADQGLAASRLVDIAGAAGWQEALGNAQLGKLGLVRTEVGRCLLAKPVIAFLDGKAPVHCTRVDGAGTRDGIADGVYRVASTITHAAIAAVVGTLGIGSFEGEKARIDAWLRAWPIVIVAMTPTALRPGELVVVHGDAAGLPDLPGV